MEFVVVWQQGFVVNAVAERVESSVSRSISRVGVELRTMSDAVELKKHVKQLQNASNNEVCLLGVRCILRRLNTALGTLGYLKDSQEGLSGQRSSAEGTHSTPSLLRVIVCARHVS